MNAKLAATLGGVAAVAFVVGRVSAPKKEDVVVVGEDKFFPFDMKSSSFDPGEDYFVHTDYSGGKHYAWKVSKIWKLAEGLPVETMEPMQVPGFARRVLFGSKKASLPQVVSECQRIARADLSFPVIVVKAPSPWSGHFLLDGAHRTSRALAEGRFVRVIELPELPPPDRVLPIKNEGAS